MEWTSLKYNVYSQFSVLHDRVAFFISQGSDRQILRVTSISAPFSFFRSSAPQIPPMFGVTFCSSINFALNIKKA
jgi:hypothetical protein